LGRRGRPRRADALSRCPAEDVSGTIEKIERTLNKTLKTTLITLVGGTPRADVSTAGRGRRGASHGTAGKRGIEIAQPPCSAIIASGLKIIIIIIRDEAERASRETEEKEKRVCE
jgi:hypothetical protein